MELPHLPSDWNPTQAEFEYYVSKRDVQVVNNCYNYATNNRTDTYAQPGRAGNRTIDWDNFSCEEVIAAASADGLVQQDCDKDCPKDSIKVMLFVDDEDDPQQPRDDRDYHWYRQDVGGNWSHKLGWSKATNLDDSQNPITDPRTADTDTRRDLDGDGNFDTGCNYEFCACFCVPPSAKIR